jgi:hypothetical protein
VGACGDGDDDDKYPHHRRGCELLIQYPRSHDMLASDCPPPCIMLLRSLRGHTGQNLRAQASMLARQIFSVA